MHATANSRDEAPAGAARLLALTFGSWLNLDELWRWRNSAWSHPAPAAVELDLGEVVEVEPDAALLLFADLAALDARGVPVRMRGIASDVRRRLRRHPICRFLGEADREDELFTDPDLDRTGFRPSRH